MTPTDHPPEDPFGTPSEAAYDVKTRAPGPAGTLSRSTETFLRDRPSGDVFGLSQDAGMGWRAAEVMR